MNSIAELHSTDGRSDLAKPFWFGPDSSRMLAWYHEPQGAALACSVLLCAPFGHEYLVSYRAYRKLAGVLAKAGFPCLFFDYDGTGDSVESAVPRVQAWRQSIISASAELRRISGISDVALFGLRTGGLLAASVAQDVGACAVMLLAPVVSGRAFVREQLSFARMSPLVASEDSRGKLTEEEVVGYPFLKQTQQDLSALDLTKMDMPCPCLVIERDDIPGQVKKLVDGWLLSGREVQVLNGAGYAAMMTQDAHSSEPPMALWDEVRDWLVPRFDTALGRRPGKYDLPVSMRVEARFIEEVLQFNGLVGVITAPSGRLPRKTGVVLTNIGTSHRVGNHLLYVHLARSLADLGYAVIRFDRAGTGYSCPAPGGVENDVYAESGIDDVRSAMSCLQTRCPCTQFVLAGLCSGAYFSYHAAALDERVKGLVLINLHSFQWNAGDSLELRVRQTAKSTDFYLRSARQFETWLRMLRGEVAVIRIGFALAKRKLSALRQLLIAGLIKAAGRVVLGSTVEQTFRKMLKRRVRVLFVFGADDASIDIVASEVGRDGANLKKPKLVFAETVKGTDHTFTPLWAQANLRDCVGTFMQTHFR